ncbi:MAG: SLC13 family permease, partial [Planctomycetes bacterium]|nr:SLC13 family permease [Planctomycetota bacterium]
MIELLLATQSATDQTPPLWHAWYTFGVLLLVCVGLAGSFAPLDIVLLAGMLAVGLAGVVSVDEMVAGFANPAVLTVGALFVVAAALRETGAMDTIGGRILGQARTERAALARTALPVVGMSAFLNNTPVVAMMIGILSDWGRKNKVSPSRLLMPLSFLAILGGTCTLIGTSTNLLINGMMIDSAAQAAAAGTPDPRLAGMGLFEMSWIGLPFVAIGVLYLLTAGRRLLPDRKDMIEQLGESAREYLVNMLVQPGCRLIDQTVEAAGLRRLPGLFLIEIERAGQRIAPVGPDLRLAQGDRLTFTGVVSTIIDLERIPGLVPEPEQKFGGDLAQRRNRRICEAVVSGTSPLVGNNIRDADFRARYNAVVVAVHRGGARLKGRIGDIVIKAGDTLLLQTGPHFARANRNSPDFFLISSLDKVRAVRHDRAAISLALLGLMVIMLIASNAIPTVLSALLVAGLMIVFRCISATEARRSVDWQVLLAMAAALALGKAMDNSGAAAAAA